MLQSDWSTAKIIIKPADKNLGIVFMDTGDYIDQCMIQLSSNTYQLVTEKCTKLPLKQGHLFNQDALCGPKGVRNREVAL